jgi:acetyl-CoA carboxylase carboxyltransferase component
VSASTLKSSINRNLPDFEKNTRRVIELLTEIKNQEEEIRQGGGAKAIASQHTKGRLTARERIEP